MIKYNSKIVPNKYLGITLLPFIFISEAKDKIIKRYGEKFHDKLINHEKIHLRQQVELFLAAILLAVVLYLATNTGFLSLFVLPLFYYLYVLNWFINLFITRNAYRNICFEREAKQNELNLDYLKTRKFFSWLKYIKIK